MPYFQVVKTHRIYVEKEIRTRVLQIHFHRTIDLDMNYFSYMKIIFSIHKRNDFNFVSGFLVIESIFGD